MQEIAGKHVSSTLSSSTSAQRENLDEEHEKIEPVVNGPSIPKIHLNKGHRKGNSGRWNKVGD